MGFLKEVQKQPENIRTIFMWLCVVIVSSFVILLGIRQTGQQIAYFANPNYAPAGETHFAETESPFSALADLLKDARSTLANIFYSTSNTQEIQKDNVNQIPPALLPVSDLKK